MNMIDKVYRLVDGNSDGAVSTGYWTSRATANVMKGRLEKAGAKTVEIEETDRSSIGSDWEGGHFDVDKWLERWTEKGKPDE